MPESMGLIERAAERFDRDFASSPGRDLIVTFFLRMRAHDRRSGLTVGRNGLRELGYAFGRGCSSRVLLADVAAIDRKTVDRLAGGVSFCFVHGYSF